MSIVSYHARVNNERLAELRADPDSFWALPEEADAEGSELLYTDKDWSALTYLLSPKAREEQKHDAALHAVQRCEDDGEDLSDDEAWRTALQREATRLGLTLVDTRALQDDALLIAIQGRGLEENRIQGIGYGALVFGPKEVAELSAVLNKVTTSDLRYFFDPKVMELLEVAGIRWSEEEPTVFDQILVPCFERIQTFFQRAADQRQHILVAHQ